MRCTTKRPLASYTTRKCSSAQRHRCGGGAGERRQQLVARMKHRAQSPGTAASREGPRCLSWEGRTAAPPCMLLPRRMVGARGWAPTTHVAEFAPLGWAAAAHGSTGPLAAMLHRQGCAAAAAMERSPRAAAHLCAAASAVAVAAPLRPLLLQLAWLCPRATCAIWSQGCSLRCSQPSVRGSSHAHRHAAAAIPAAAL